MLIAGLYSMGPSMLLMPQILTVILSLFLLVLRKFLLIYVLNQNFPNLLPEIVCGWVLMSRSPFALAQTNTWTLYSSHTDVYFAQPSVPFETQKRSQKMNSHLNSLSEYIDKQLGSQQNKSIDFHSMLEKIALHRSLRIPEECGILVR